MDHGTSRTAIVTEAGRGIGAVVARGLYRDGHKVALLDRDGEAAAATAEAMDPTGTSVIAVTADVADERSVSEAVAAATEALGPPTILVNNAGSARDQPLDGMPIADWDAVVDVHLQGAFLTTWAVCGHMREAGWGRIVNVSSTSALGDDDGVN